MANKKRWFTLKRLSIAGLILVLLGILAFWWLQSQLSPENIRQTIVNEIKKNLPSEATLELREAQMVIGEGLYIRDLKILLPAAENSHDELVSLEEAFLAYNTSDLIAGNLIPKKIVLQGLHAHLHRDREGRWKHQILTEANKSSDSDSDSQSIPDRLPKIVLKGGSVYLTDELLIEPDYEFHLEDIHLHLSPKVASKKLEEIQFQLRGNNEFLPDVNLHGSVSLADRHIEVSHLASRLHLDDNQVAALPKKWQNHLNKMGLRGDLELIGQVKIDSEGSIKSSDLNATLTNGKCELFKEGLSFEGVSGRLTLINENLGLHSLRGLSTAGSFSADGSLSLNLRDSLENIAIQKTFLDAKFDQIFLNERLIRTFPDPIEKWFQENEIHGDFSIHSVLKSEGWNPKLENWDISLTAEDLDARFELFAYPLEALRGQIHLKQGVLKFEPALTGLAGTGAVKVFGELNLVDRATGKVNPQGRITIGWTGGTANSKLRNCIPREGRPIWDEFQPIGKTGGEVVLNWREETGSYPEVLILARPENIKCQYKNFPVPLNQVRGELQLDFHKGTVTIPEIKASYRRNPITARGILKPTDENLIIDLTIHCPTLPLDPKVFEALPGEVRNYLEDLRLTGQAGVEVRIRNDADKEISTEVIVLLGGENRLVIHPPGFASPIILEKGKIIITEGGVRFDQVEGSSNAELVINGSLFPQPDRWVAQLNGQIKNLSVDARFLSFLSEQNRRALENAHLEGIHSFHYESEFSFPKSSLEETQNEKPVPLPYSYKLTQIKSEHAGINIGISLREVSATGEVYGEGELGKSHRCNGLVKIQSARFNRLLLKDTHLDFVYGQKHPILENPEKHKDILIDRASRDRLLGSSLQETLQILVPNASLYGGEVRGFCYADLGLLGDIKGNMLAKSIDISKAARDVFQDEKLDSKGIGSGEVRFSGLTGKPDSLLGRGEVKIVQGDIANFPVLSELLKTLKLDRAVKFNKLEANFSIQSQKFRVLKDELKISSPVMDLTGRGSMDFNSNLALQLTPNLIPGKFLVIPDVLNNLSNIAVSGPVSQPKVELQVLKFD